MNDCKILMCESCGYISRHWNGKINLFVADFVGEDDCPNCGRVMRSIDWSTDKDL